MNKMIAKRYMVVKHIGQGGMADVYVAVDTLLNREVAVKVLRGELSNDPVALLRFSGKPTPPRRFRIPTSSTYTTSARKTATITS